MISINPQIWPYSLNSEVPKVPTPPLESAVLKLDRDICKARAKHNVV